MVTIQSIADQLGLSSATVSRALNNDPKISAQTKARVSALAEELGYAGTGGRKRRQCENVIGIICPEIISNNYSSVVETLSENLHDKGYQSVIMITSSQKNRERMMLEQLTRLNVAGICFFTNKDSSTVELLDTFKRTHPKLPLVLIVNSWECANYDSLMISSHHAVELVVDHLYDLGHRAVAVISDKAASGRAELICNQLRKKGISLQKNWIIFSDLRFEEGGYQATNELLQLQERPTAIIAAYDYLAIGALKACYDAGIQVPEEISIAGIDGVITSQFSYKSLTTVSMPHVDIGRIASRILIDRIQNSKNQSAIQHVTLTPRLLVRQSTALPPSPEGDET